MIVIGSVDGTSESNGAASPMISFVNVLAFCTQWEACKSDTSKPI